MLRKSQSDLLCDIVVAVLLFVFPSYSYAFDPSTDHKCVAYCDGDPVEVRRGPGPPIIIWRRPSPEGSRQSDFKRIDNSEMQAVLNDWSVTSWNLYLQGQSALKKGDKQAAAAYCQAALTRNPPENELSDINTCIGRARAQQVFDNADGTKGAMPGFKFRKTPTYPAVQIPSALYDLNRHDLDPIRKELEPLLVDQQQDLENIRTMQTQNVQPRENAMKEMEAHLKSVQGRLEEKMKKAKVEYHLE